MWTMLGWLRAEAARASRSSRCSSSGSGPGRGERAGGGTPAMSETVGRRAFLFSLAGSSIVTALAPRLASGLATGTPRTSKIKLSCNLYSFNAPLRSGEMTLEQAIDFCAELGFDAVDPTGYSFPGHT